VCKPLSRSPRPTGNGVSDWSTFLSDDLKLDVHIEYVSGVPTKFGFNLSGYVDDVWIDLVRVDNAHEESLPPHRHVFHPDGSEDFKHFVAALPESLVGWAQEHLVEDGERYLDEYRRQLANSPRKGQQ
jgi:hypothetical protein